MLTGCAPESGSGVVVVIGGRGSAEGSRAADCRFSGKLCEIGEKIWSGSNPGSFAYGVGDIGGDCTAASGGLHIVFRHFLWFLVHLDMHFTLHAPSDGAHSSQFRRRHIMYTVSQCAQCSHPIHMLMPGFVSSADMAPLFPGGTTSSLLLLNPLASKKSFSVKAGSCSVRCLVTRNPCLGATSCRSTESGAQSTFPISDNKMKSRIVEKVLFIRKCKSVYCNSLCSHRFPFRF